MGQAPRERSVLLAVDQEFAGSTDGRRVQFQIGATEADTFGVRSAEQEPESFLSAMIFVIVGLLLLVPGFHAYVTTRGEVTLALIYGGVLVLIGSWIMPGRSSLPPPSNREPPASLPRRTARGPTSQP
jgi:hypothetical protein